MFVRFDNVVWKVDSVFLSELMVDSCVWYEFCCVCSCVSGWFFIFMRLDISELILMFVLILGMEIGGM